MRYLLIAFLFSSFLFSTEVIQDESHLKILTPSLSQLQERKIRLNNGLEVLIVSDPGLDKSGVAISVNAGSWSNPTQYLGMAHFLEHMLFLGTTKYPQEGSFENFLDEHAGQHNAFTGEQRTVYMITMNNDGFLEGLDRLSQFFISPLFSSSGVNRELNAIDQEYKKNLEDDAWRFHFVRSALLNSEHPDSRFAIGNQETLSNVPPAALRQWFESHYSANLMHLVVYSPLPLDIIQEAVEKDFGAIVNRNLQPLNVTIPLTNPKYNGSLITITPYQDIKELFIQWDLPYAGHEQTRTVCAALTQEEDGSLIDLLKNEELADSIDCMMIGEKPRLLFYLIIDLTDKGVAQVNSVIQHCFEEIALLQEKGIPEKFVEEATTMATLHYEYQSRGNLFSQITREADLLIDEPLATYPRKTLLPPPYDAKALHEVLLALTPSNAQVYLLAKPSLTHVKENLEEPWAHVKYSITPIAKDLLARWQAPNENPALTLPAANPYIPSDLIPPKMEEHAHQSLIPQPHSIVDEEGVHVYFAKDERYFVPELISTFRIHTTSRKPGNSLQDVLLDFYLLAISDQLSNLIDQGDRANLYFSIDPIETGLQLTFKGYTQKAPDFFKDLASKLKTITINQQQFGRYKDLLALSYENSSLDPPYLQIRDLLKSIVHKNNVPDAKKAAAIGNVSLASVNTFISHLFDQTYIEGVIYGNVDEQISLAFADTLRSALQTGIWPKNEIPKKEVLLLDQEKGPFLLSKTIKQLGNATLLFIEDKCFTLRRRSALSVLFKGLAAPFFTELRTKQQTGYIVQSTALEWERVLCGLFLVQSDQYPPCDLLARFELFLEQFLADFEEKSFPEERFSAIKSALITELQAPPKNMAEMGSILDTLAFDYDADFNWIDQKIEALKDLTYDEFTAYAKEMIGRSNKRRLALELYGSNSNECLTYLNVPSVAKLRSGAGTFKDAHETICTNEE